jgi:hypothetical protein
VRGCAYSLMINTQISYFHRIPLSSRFAIICKNLRILITHRSFIHFDVELVAVFQGICSLSRGSCVNFIHQAPKVGKILRNQYWLLNESAPVFCRSNPTPWIPIRTLWDAPDDLEQPAFVFNLHCLSNQINFRLRINAVISAGLLADIDMQDAYHSGDIAVSRRYKEAETLAGFRRHL